MKLTWGDTRLYENGVDRGVFYPKGGVGVPWIGLTSVKESVEGDGSTVIYVDGRKQINQLQLGAFSATIEAFTYPDEFELYDGYSEFYANQNRPLFDFSYRTWLPGGAYKLHLVYNCLVKPTTRQSDSLTDGSDILNFSWDLSTTPIPFPYDRPTAHLYVNSTQIVPSALLALESVLYGSDSSEPHMPRIPEIMSLFDANAIFQVVDNGDGTCTVSGPDGWVDQDAVDPTKWTLSSPSVIQMADPDLYLVRSY